MHVKLSFLYNKLKQSIILQHINNNNKMTMAKKLIITLLLLISIVFVHSSSFRVEVEEEFEPPHAGEQERPGRGPGGVPGRGPGSGSSEEEEERSRDHPYHYRKRSFESWFRSKEGFVKILPKFTKRSPFLFRGIENYRFWLAELEPTTFLVPHHFDADSVFLVLQGQGVIEFVTDNTNEAFHIIRGDVVRIPSGVTHFITNTNQTVPFRLAKLAVPVNIPGYAKDYFPAPSQFQQSYLTGFSKEVLSTSFNLPEELVEKLVRKSKQINQGIIRSVSPDQIKELTQHATDPSKKHKKHKDKDKSVIFKPFNIFEKDPIYSNDFGHFHEARPKKFDQLQDLHVSVAWVSIKQGSVLLPHFDSKATFVLFVENGCARFEMASPYKFHGEQQQQWPGQQQEEKEELSGNIYKIVSHVCKGDVFINPAGHPFTILTQDQDFVVTGFGIHATDNTRTFLAGKENMLNNLNTVATRLTFGVGREVAEKLFTSQNFTYFAPTNPSRQQFPQNRKPSFQSIFNYAGF